MNPRKTSRNIAVGSAIAYCMEFTDKVPANTVIETEDNHIGDIEGGLTITYTTENQTLKDDYGNVKRTIITSEDAKAKLGLITWDYENLNKVVSTARTTVSDDGTTRITKLGGLSNDNGKKWLFHFVHEDKVAGDVRITIVGTNTAGLTLAYTKDAATKLEPEITGEPSDDDGTLIIFQESLTSASSEAAESSTESQAAESSTEGEGA